MLYNRIMNYEKCTLCPRECGLNRTKGVGLCHAGGKIKAARAALHFWEEPPISGENGSGAIFFCGCQLGCVYCQNKKIAEGKIGFEISPQRLYEIFFELKEKGAHNINLVTPDCYIPEIIPVIKKAKADGINLPFICNCSGYEKAEVIRNFGSVIDIWLPDFKYIYTETAKKYSNAPNYPSIAKSAIDEMVRLCPKPIFEGDLMKKGVMVRHLVLPEHSQESKVLLKYLFDKFENSIYYSIMSQYTPVQKCEYGELNRPLDLDEYNRVVDYAVELGIVNAFIQGDESASESFIPEWNGEGVVKFNE